MKTNLSLLIAIGCMWCHQVSAELIKFNSSDGVEITADLYMLKEKTAPFIILFHQANWSRGEYHEIAPRLNMMGYNCLAVDLRSGGAINDVTNVTNQNAVKAMKNTTYIDAYQDMEAALDYVKANLADGKIIVWGSSYSSALALKLAGDYSGEVDAVLAFSPGEYFISQGKSRDFISTAATKITQKAFITSARSEKGNWWGIYVAISSADKSFFIPQTSGNHGSRALWVKFDDSKFYWEAVKDFLESI